MTNSPMTNPLEMRWVATTDEHGRTRMECRWVDTSVDTRAATSAPVEVAQLVDRAA